IELWNDYLEGEQNEADTAELRRLLEADERLAELAADTYAIHRLLNLVAEDDESQRDGFVRETMATLPAGENEFVGGVMDQIHPTESQAPPRFARWSMMAVAATIVVALSAGLIYQLTQSESGNPDASNTIARITGLSGSLIWTGDGGKVVRDMTVGTELAGGTIEGIAPDSWFELQFHDGSTVMISGTSTLTFADFGQKLLRLREGRLSADVSAQPPGKPMLIHTRSAVLKVLGTQFDVEADLTSTVLNVSEGKVRLTRISDGSEVDVPAKHQVVAEDERDLTPELVADSVHHWKSRLQHGPGGYGKWLPATAQRSASQKAIPFVPSANPNVTLYLLSIPVSRSDSSPVVVQPDSRIVVRGRLHKPAKVYLGIGMSYVNGEFAGKFLAGKFRGDLG
ncbi:MAG: FecR family protein, partial [Pirellulaceae bacterium]|nr:FecR family protein [Pirellulaceae bacterium]